MNTIAEDDGSGRTPRIASRIGAMTMPSIVPLRKLKGPATIAALGTLVAVLTGHALVEQMERHTANDRFSFGMTLDSCIRGSCPTSYVSFQRPRQQSHSAVSDATQIGIENDAFETTLQRD